MQEKNKMRSPTSTEGLKAFMDELRYMASDCVEAEYKPEDYRRAANSIAIEAGSWKAGLLLHLLESLTDEPDARPPWESISNG